MLCGLEACTYFICLGKIFAQRTRRLSSPLSTSPGAGQHTLSPADIFFVISLCTLSDYSAMKLEANHRKKTGKARNSWKLYNMLLNNEWMNQEIKEEIRK